MGTTVSHPQIRKLSSNDIARLVDLEAGNQPTPWSEAVFSDEIQADNRVYLAVIDGDDVFAYGGIMVTADEAHVLNLLVAPDQRRKGHARSLMVELLKEAVGLGAKHLTLEVRSRNHVAINLYQQLGLAPVGVRPGYYGDDDALIMWVHDIDAPGFLEGLGGPR
jgi:ribosomal-protein-alanine N-acetyltransferase